MPHHGVASVDSNEARNRRPARRSASRTSALGGSRGLLGPPSHPTPRRGSLAACTPGRWFGRSTGRDKFTSHTRRIVMRTAVATPPNAPRRVCTPLTGCFHDRPPPAVATDRRPQRASRSDSNTVHGSSPQGLTDSADEPAGAPSMGACQQGRRGGPRLGAHGVGTTSGDHRWLARTCGRRRGWRRRARPTTRRGRASARRLSVDSSLAPTTSAASGADGAATTVAPPPAKPAIASINARSTANHRDRPRPASSAPARHPIDSWVGGGSRGTGSPVEVDINRRSLPPREATTTGPRAEVT